MSGNSVAETGRGRARAGEQVTGREVADAEARHADFFADGDGRQPAYLAFNGEVPIALDASMPRAAYRSRGLEVKTACHWGQRKLLISEMQLLTYFCEPGASYWIVYVGAAPGSHLMFLDELYSGRHTWELIDPGAWDHRYSALPAPQRRRFNLRNEFFDNAQAYELVERRIARAGLRALSSLYAHIIATAAEADDRRNAATTTLTDGSNPEAARTTEVPIKYVAPLEPVEHGLHTLLRVAAERTKMLFISDVRSGSEKACEPGDFDLHVHENMRAQAAWSDIINPTFAMLKFRLPYSFISKYDMTLKKRVSLPSKLPPTSQYRDGTMLLPVWTRPTSTECRHVIPQNAPMRVYDHKEFEDQMFFFNAVLRERAYFEHGFHGHPWVDHRYDGAAEVALLTKFIRDRRRLAGQRLDRTAELQELAQLVDEISRAIGSSFERAYTNREAIHVSKAHRAGWQDATNARLQAARDKRAEAIWHRALLDGEKAAAFDDAQPFVWALHPLTPSS